MTRDEALKQIRNWSLPEETREVLEALIPELAESEDERIRKKMIEHFKSKTKETWCNMPVKSILDYLEKQKDLDKMIVVSPEVWDNAISDAFENGKKEGEKQKESPKSADSIPSECTSDAKCENSWHKVGDSLPDNPREVLCKDEAGNFFIGRYYVGEGWEISNYDDEDKPHDLNPPVSKWIDFPSEKQKEQPLPLFKGNPDGYFDEWNQQHTNPTKRQCFEEGMRYAERLREEQKPSVPVLPCSAAWFEDGEQKPVWSEEDETRRNCCMIYLASIRDRIEFSQDISDNAKENGKKEIQKDIDWLKSLSLNLKKKNEDVAKLCSNEWSEEDSEMLTRIINQVGGYTYFAGMDSERVVNWLKSLHPQPHWTKEDKHQA